MPGLTLSLHAASAATDPGAFDRAQEGMLHGARYETRTLVEAPTLRVGCVTYPGYPLRTVEAGGVTVVFEGRAYTESPERLDESLGDLATRVLANGDEARASIEKWTAETEGEYLVLMVRPQDGHVLLFTDPLGRLPVYWYVTDDRLLLARECKFIRAQCPEMRYDRVAFAQTLWCGYPLGERTLLEGVRRGKGAMLLRGGCDGPRVWARAETLFTLNLEEKDHSGGSVQQHAEGLAGTLVNVCRRWGSHPEARGNLLSLSGGHDSRVVACALHKAGVPFTAISYLDAKGRSSSDAEQAAEVAAALGVEHVVFRTAPVSHRDAERLVWMRDGLNYAGMAFILDYLRQIVDRWDTGAVYITGDGGDKLLPSLFPSRRFQTSEALCAWLARAHAISPMDKAEAVFGLEPGTLREELRALVADYPERSLGQRAVHFAFYERGRKWLYEGEDRTRAYLWETSPFYALGLYRQCMLVPDGLKAHNELYRSLLQQLCPQCAEIGMSWAGRKRPAPASRSYWLSVRRRAALRKAASIARRLKIPYPSRTRRPVGLSAPEGEAIWQAIQPGCPFAQLLDTGSAMPYLESASAREIDMFRTLVLYESFWREGPPSPGSP